MTFLYTSTKARSNKCCTKIFLEAYEFTPNINSIWRRFNDCFYKAYASSETSKIAAVKDKKLNSWDK